MLEEPIGVSLLALLIIKELFSYLKAHDGKEHRKSVGDELERTLKGSIIPIMNQQVLILNELKKLAVNAHDAHIHLQSGIDSLKITDERIQTDVSNISHKLQGRNSEW